MSPLCYVLKEGMLSNKKDTDFDEMGFDVILWNVDYKISIQ